MLDKKLLKEKIYLTAKKLNYRQFKLDIKTFKKQEKYRKFLQLKVEKLQAERNSKSRRISIMKSNGEDITFLCQEVVKIRKKLKDTKIELDLIKNSIRNYELLIPNITNDDVPIGNNKNFNKEILKWGNKNNCNTLLKNHVDLGKNNGNLDLSLATKITGSRFAVMKHNIARLYRILSQFMLETHTTLHNYIEYYVPYLVNFESLYGAGQLPKFSNDLFYTHFTNKTISHDKSYALIPTAEVPLINIMRNKIIEENELPIKMVACTPCFRSEAGAYGQDTKGLIRMHQFDKVEMIQFVKPENSFQALEELTNHAEKILRLLDLPYRKVLLCTGDTGFTSCKTYDLEVWLPVSKTYKEISSCSNTSDFQSRRMKIRYRNSKNSKLELVHIINGSGLAVGRTLVAIMENYQQSNGKIKIPNVLKPYMNGLTYI
ncbi:MAG: serine--tRNA ligase [Candidatus Lightella neohaematopini]|nr:serine--tRNA ligase [Candidatus Lightella neohaematopini]MCV2531000.1 serine--tRNA ligase [Candidatus Lightella neohaematopini]